MSIYSMLSAYLKFFYVNKEINLDKILKNDHELSDINSMKER
jgi:hypothetical protein